jgi:phosphate-selective porin OprO/OprP
MKEPFSLEELTSSKNITFVERSLGSIFDSSRNFGVLFKNTYFDKRMTASAGVFAETGSTGKYFSDDTDMNVTGRITGLPLYQDDGRFLIHLGASLIQRISDDAERRFRQRPEIHLAKRYVDTGEYDSDGASILGLEFAAILGPVSIQAEHRHAFIDNRGPSSLGDPITNNNFQIHASNVELSWFVTGENRNYQTSSGTLGRITPKRAFDPEGGGYGAWEVAVRYSHIDLQDEGMNGGEEQNVTVGTNWYLYSNVRLSLNYVYADVDDTGDFLGNASGDLHSVHSRLQVDF